MMKSKSSQIFLGLVAACALYSGFWYYQAKQFEKNIATELDSFIAKNFKDSHVQYDGTKIRGFPFDITIALINPKIAAKGQESMGSSHFWLTGDIAATFSLFGKLKAAVLEGVSHGSLFFIDAKVPSLLHFDGKTAIRLESIHALADKGTIVLSDFNMAGGKEITGHANPLWKGELVVHYAYREPTPERLHIDLDVTQKAHPVESRELSPKTSEELFDAGALLLNEAAGERSSSYKMKLDIPTAEVLQELATSPLKLLTQAIPNISIVISNFQSSSKIDASSGSFSLSLQEDSSSTISLQYRVSGITKIFNNFYEALTKVVDKLPKLAFTWQPEGDQVTIKVLFMQHLDALKALIPKLNELGDIQYKQDVTLQLNKHNLDWKVEVADFATSCEHFGFDLSGAIASDRGSRNGALSLKLKNSSDVVRGLIDYYNRIIVVANILADNKPTLKPLTDASYSKIMNYLASIGKTDAKEPDVLDIQFSLQDGQMKIGSFDFDTFKAKTTELSNELLQETNPPPIPALPPPSNLKG